jgi:hypothetical protein
VEKEPQQQPVPEPRSVEHENEDRDDEGSVIVLDYSPTPQDDTYSSPIVDEAWLNNR